MKRPVYWIFLLHVILFVHGNKAGASQPYRTAYHFQPPKNWMNDPNGPMYYKGVYHLFYQYNPYAAVWGNISWAHSVSYNLIDWLHLDNAINPTEPYDINGCWSGSATILPGVEKPVILYTGDNFDNHQVQNLAVPKNMSDPLLREWVKSGRNPLMTPVNGMDPKMYRDPTTAWQGSDKIWRVIIGGQINGHGTAILYRSKDFVSWTRSRNPLHSSNKTGMWECPDFYPVSSRGKNAVEPSFYGGRDTKHILKASFGDHHYYVIGNYDSKTDYYTADVDFMDGNVQLRLRYDYGVFYASKSFYDSGKKRRILWGWVTEADSKSDDIKKGWSGIQSIPRTILLDKSGKQLVQWPIKELEKLRETEVSLRNEEIKGGTVFKIAGVITSQADIEVSFELPNLEDGIESMNTKSVDPQQLCSQKNSSVRGILGPFGLLVLASKDLTEQTAIFFRIFKGDDKFVVLMCSDQSRSSLKRDVGKNIFGAFLVVDPTQKISLRTLIDHSIVESFGGEGKACITARVYPELAIDDKSYLYAFNYGTQSVRISSLRAWSMKKARMVKFHEGKKPLIN